MVSSHLQIALTVGPNSVVVSLPFYVMMGTDPPPTNVFFFQHKTTNKVQTLEYPRVTYYHQKALELVQYFSNLIAPSDTDELPGECCVVRFALLEVLCLQLPLAAPCSVTGSTTSSICTICTSNTFKLTACWRIHFRVYLGTSNKGKLCLWSICTWLVPHPTYW